MRKAKASEKRSKMCPVGASEKKREEEKIIFVDQRADIKM
jgi:hypothetical protein